MTATAASIALKLAKIADTRACILRASGYDLPEGIEDALDKAERKWKAENELAPDKDDRWFDSEGAREKLADDYVKEELSKLQDDALEAGIAFDVSLMKALIEPLGAYTHWNSSSYGC